MGVRREVGEEIKQKEVRRKKRHLKFELLEFLGSMVENIFFVILAGLLS